MGTRLLRSLAMLLTMGVPALASAHPLVDQAHDAYREARFDVVHELLDQALASGELTRDDLANLLELRALAHRGAGATGEMDRALEVLAVIAEPGHSLGPEAPPTVQRRWAEIVENAPAPPELDVEVASDGGRTILTGRADRDDLGIVAAVRIHARAGGGAWQSGENRLSLDAAGAVEWYAEAVGPGGVVLAEDGTAEAPHLVAGEDGSVAPIAGGDSAEGGAPWLLIGAGAVAVAVGVLIVVLATSGDDTTQLSGLQIDFGT